MEPIADAEPPVARRPLLATYRLQLRPGFGFDEAASVLPYLARLGVTHVYCSPYLATVPDSLHGYDVVDHRRVREDLGGDAAFERFVAALDGHGLGQIVDIVPHHMSIAGTGNAWWWDVLRFGQRSAYATWFDIDWDPPEPRLRSRILLPVLGDHYGRVLEDGELTIDQQADASFVVRYHDVTFPLSPDSEGMLLIELAASLGHDRLGFLGRALVAADQEGRSPAELDADVREIHGLLVELQEGDHEFDRAVRAHLALVNADVDRVDALLALQHHRLARWHVGAYELDYRRFFDVDSLIALRTDRREVFDATHGLMLSLVQAGIVDGLRVDHIDGLRDPFQYLGWLRDASGPTAYLFVEKILAAGEALPPWPVEGTTGYDAAALITGVLVDGAGAERLRRRYVELTERPDTYREVSRSKRRLVLATVLVSDVERLTNILVRVCDSHRRWRDFTRVELREAMMEILVHLPVYRSYVHVVEDIPAVAEADLDAIDLGVAMAREARPDLDPELFDLMRAILVLQLDDLDARELVLRFQQLSGSVVAKGDEDSADYAWGPLLARNEVGVDPDDLAVTIARFHEAAAARQQHWPRSMTATATHDTKRGEDVRARLAVLSEIPGRYADAFVRWWGASAEYRSADAPDPATAWLVFQTLVGAHPLPLARALAYVEKAIREAKEQTSWLSPDADFEAAVAAFVTGVLEDDELMDDIAGFVATIEPAGQVNALAQVALRLLGPGVPDTYQGTELWDDSLVDPDNRRLVDYGLRTELLDLVAGVTAAEAWQKDRALGVPKLLLVQRCLQVRHAHPEAFDERGTYVPLIIRGPRAEHALGFVRGGRVATVVPRHPLTLGEAADEVEVALPSGTWTDALSPRELVSDGWVTLGRLTREFPVAVLVATAG